MLELEMLVSKVYQVMKNTLNECQRSEQKSVYARLFCPDSKYNTSARNARGERKEEDGQNKNKKRTYKSSSSL